MNELTTAEKIQQMRGLSLKVRDLSGMSRDSMHSKEQIVKYALQKNYNLDGKELDLITASIMNNAETQIQIGDKRMSAQEASLSTARLIQDFPSFKPKEKWLDEAKNVIKEMTDGEITAQDLSHRNLYLGNIESRQVELRTALSLYQNNKLPIAREFEAKILEVLAMLEKTKTVIKKSTKDSEQALQEPQITPEEQNKAKVYMGVLDYMAQNKKVPAGMETKLEINNGITFDYSLAETLIKDKSTPQSLQSRVQRINELRGRQSALNTSKSELRHLNNFNAKQFQMLMEQQQRTM